jgi:hypothetical protein
MALSRIVCMGSHSSRAGRRRVSRDSELILTLALRMSAHPTGFHSKV